MELSERNRILELCRNGQKLEAVKLCKEITGLDLKSAKDIIDSLENGNEDKLMFYSNSNMEFMYKIQPVKVDTSMKYEDDHRMSADSTDFIMWAIIIEVIAIIIAIFSGGGTFWIWGLVVIGAFYGIRKLNNDSKDATETERVITFQKKQANIESEFYSNKLNSILTKSKEIMNQILPYCEESALKCIQNAKVDFLENAFSPFWSEIEKASKFLAYYKEALDQLCLNSELYNYTLKNKSHNFPIPFPFATNISISQKLIDEYKSTIRKAQTNPTFSIIWEQRRNSDILIAGFTTLEHTISNMSSDILYAINELNHSISSELNSIKHIQKDQLRSFESSQAYLNHTLNSMDNKLYYIQWKQRPPGIFYNK